jgi:cytochrome P450
MPNFFPLTSVPLYAGAEAFAYVKLVASQNGNPSFIRYFAAAIAFNFTLWVVFWGWLDAKYISPLRKFPVTKATSSESIFARAKMTRPPGSIFLDWIRATKNDGVIRAPFPMVNGILLTAPDTLAEVLVHRPYDFEKPSGARDVLRMPLGDGLIIVEGDIHKFQRKHLMPSFGFRNVKQLYPMMWKKSLDLMGHISAEILDQGLEKQTGRIEINSWASKATMDIIGVAGIGTEFNAMHDPNVKLMKDYEEMLTPDPMRIVHFFLSVTFGWGIASRLPLQTNYDFHRLVESMHSISSRLVKEKRAAMALGGDHFDILGLLIKSNDFSDDQLADQVLTFLGAG